MATFLFCAEAVVQLGLKNPAYIYTTVQKYANGEKNVQPMYLVKNLSFSCDGFGKCGKKVISNNTMCLE